MRFLIATGIALFSALFPNCLQSVAEGFFHQQHQRKRYVTGPAWTVAAMATALPALVSRLGRLGNWGKEASFVALVLLSFVLVLFLAWVLLTVQCTKLAGQGTQTPQLFRNFKSEARKLNAVGLFLFFGVVLFMLLFVDRLWSH